MASAGGCLAIVGWGRGAGGVGGDRSNSNFKFKFCCQFQQSIAARVSTEPYSVRHCTIGACIYYTKAIRGIYVNYTMKLKTNGESHSSGGSDDPSSIGTGEKRHVYRAPQSATAQLTRIRQYYINDYIVNICVCECLLDVYA